MNRIVICSPQLGLSPKSVLGGEVFDREILLGLARRGIKIEIILPRGSNHDKNIKNWNIHFLPISHFPAVLANIIYLFPLFITYNRYKFDILRIHQPQFFGLAAIIFKLFNKNVKILANYHQFKETNFLIFSKIINNFWDSIVVDSEKVKRELIEKYAIRENKITVVHNGVPLYLKPEKKDKHLLKKFGLEGKFILLFMGFFIPRKNPVFLLDLLKRINNSKIIAIFWGNGYLKRSIKLKSQELGLGEQVKFIEPAFGRDKIKIHNLADIFVHPSLDEGFALAPLESMACSKPVIMNASHSAREAIDNGLNGFICRVNNVNDWLKKIMILYKNKKLLNKMSHNARKKALRDFNWEKSVGEHVNLIGKL